MEWKTEDIIKVLGGGGVFTAIAAAMGWLRFGKKDKAEVGKLRSETILDIATVLEKKVSDDSKILTQALDWNMILVSQREKDNAMIDKLKEENDRLHGDINTLKSDFNSMIGEFNKRIKQLEDELEKSKQELIREREENKKQIEILKSQRYGDG